MPNNTKDSQVYIVDDDTLGTRNRYKVAKTLRERGVPATVIGSFTELKRLFKANAINPNALFVMDSTLIEPGHLYDFYDTVPWLVTEGKIKPSQIMPASSAQGGFEMNDSLRAWFEVKFGYIAPLEQQNLAITGLTGDPVELAKSIINYLERMVTPTEGQVEGESTRW